MSGQNRYALACKKGGVWHLSDHIYETPQDAAKEMGRIQQIVRNRLSGVNQVLPSTESSELLDVDEIMIIVVSCDLLSPTLVT